MKLLLLKDGPSWPLNHFKCLPHVRLLTFLTARHKCSVFNKHVLNYLITSRTKSLVVEQGGSWMIDYRITIFSLQLSGNRCLFQSSSTAPTTVVNVHCYACFTDGQGLAQLIQIFTLVVIGLVNAKNK